MGPLSCCTMMVYLMVLGIALLLIHERKDFTESYWTQDLFYRGINQYSFNEVKTMAELKDYLKDDFGGLAF